MVIFFFFLALFVRLLFLPYQAVVSTDSFYFVEKAIEIVNSGNFSPLRSFSLGWPLFLSFFFSFVKNWSFESKLIFAQVISSILGALTIFPLYALAKGILKKTGLVVLFFVFSFLPSLVESSWSAQTEPLFSLLFVSTILFLQKTPQKFQNLWFAVILGSLAFWVRPNGAFTLLIILAYLGIIHKEVRFKAKVFFLVPVLYLAIILPVLIQRQLSFGSPFFYDVASKILVQNLDQALDPNVKNPSLGEFLQTNSVFDIVDKFLIKGVKEFISTATHPHGEFDPVFNTLILFAIPFFYRKNWRNVIVLPILLGVLLWIISLIPLFSIHHKFRYLVPAVPLTLIATAKMIELFGKNRIKKIFILIFLGIFGITSALKIVALRDFAIQNSKDYYSDTIMNMDKLKP